LRGGVVEIMVCQVINVGSRNKQLGAPIQNMRTTKDEGSAEGLAGRHARSFP
jgi:hypothetical protein